MLVDWSQHPGNAEKAARELFEKHTNPKFMRIYYSVVNQTDFYLSESNLEQEILFLAINQKCDNLVSESLQITLQLTLQLIKNSLQLMHV